MKLHSVLLSLVLLVGCTCCRMSLYAQERNIVKVLNKALRAEKKVQEKDSGNYCGQPFDIITPYQITGKRLSVTIKRQLPEEDAIVTETYEVALDSVINIVKDINILFETWPESAIITRHTVYKNEPAKTDVFKTNLFFLQLCHETNNEAFADALIKAFQKAGYALKKRHWYD